MYEIKKRTTFSHLQLKLIMNWSDIIEGEKLSEPKLSVKYDDVGSFSVSYRV